jgi:hypothetical protein
MKKYNKVKCSCNRCYITIVANDVDQIGNFVDSHQHRDQGGQSFSLEPIEEHVQCGVTKAPGGWYCTRVLNHPGPCAAIPISVLE